jgi:uncharacterized membrane protein YfcA
MSKSEKGLDRNLPKGVAAFEERGVLMAGLMVGLIAGLLGGLVGVGGGVVVVPLMTDVLKFRQQEAHGTSLVTVVVTAAAGSFVYYLHGSVELPAAAVLAGMALCTIRLGARYCCFLPESKLKRYFGIFLLFISLLLILKTLLPHVTEGSLPAWIRWIVLVLLGLMTGFISGMMGVGGGSFMIPIMVLFADTAQHTAQGISLLAMIPASTVGVWTHWKMGNVRRAVLPGLIVGVLAGVFLGGSIAHLIPEMELRLVYAVLLVCMAVRYLYK